MNSEEWQDFKNYREKRINSVVDKSSEDWEAIKAMTVNEFNDFVLIEYLQKHYNKQE